MLHTPGWHRVCHIQRDAVPFTVKARGCCRGHALTIEIFTQLSHLRPPPPPRQKTAKYVFLSVRWVLGVPVPFHNFFPKFITTYVLTKMPYLYFLLISALQARTPHRCSRPGSPAFL